MSLKGVFICYLCYIRSVQQKSKNFCSCIWTFLKAEIMAKGKKSVVFWFFLSAND